MKKFKLAAILVSAALLCAGSLLFTACAEQQTSSEEEGLYYPQEETQEASLVLSAVNLTVEQYGSAALTAVADGVEGEIAWSVSDAGSSVIRYENGRVYGLGVGSAKVTASVGSGENVLQAECSVVVTESTAAPVLQLNVYTVEIAVGGSFTVVPSVTWQGEPVTDALEYSYSFADGAIQYATSLARQENGSAVITGRSEGTTQYIVATTCRGIMVVESFTVIVRDTVLFLSNDLTPTENGYELNLNVGDVFSPEIEVYVGGERQQSPALTWRSYDADIASVSAAGEITAKARGTVSIVCTYSGEDFRFICRVSA